jgi:DNA repair protein RadD
VKLHKFQVDWVRRIRAALKSHRSVLCVGATGCGKTVVAAHLIRAAVKDGLRVLFLAHRQELVAQAFHRLHERGVESAGIIMAGFPEDRAQPVQVASVQTLTRRDMPPADLVIVDEAHHGKARTYLEILAHYPKAKVLGLTATPVRGDGKPLGDLFEVMVQAPPPSELIALGFLASPRCYSWKSPDLQDVKVAHGDYEQAELGRRMSDPVLIGDAVAHWQKFARHLPTVCYAVNVAHAEALTARFAAAGARVALLTGTTRKDLRTEMLDALQSGGLDLIVNVGVLTEGWDAPKVRCVIVMRPTLSEGLHLQMVGRIMRPGVRPIVLDHALNVPMFGTPDVDRKWVISEARCAKGKHGSRQTETKTCPECDSECSKGTRICSGCDHEFWDAKGSPTEDVSKWLQEVNGPGLRERAIEMMRNGSSIDDAAGSVGVSYTCALRWRKLAGLPSSVNRCYHRQETRKKAETLILSGAHDADVAKAVQVTHSTIRRWRAQLGAPPSQNPYVRVDEKRAAILDLARSGYSNKEIANLTGLGRGSVRLARSKAGVPQIEGTKAFRCERRLSAIEASRSGTPASEIARRLGVHHSTVCGWICATEVAK